MKVSLSYKRGLRVRRLAGGPAHFLAIAERHNNRSPLNVRMSYVSNVTSSDWREMKRSA